MSALLAMAASYRLAPKATQAIEHQVRDAVRGWDKRAKALGLRNVEIDLMHPVIDAER